MLGYQLVFIEDKLKTILKSQFRKLNLKKFQKLQRMQEFKKSLKDLAEFILTLVGIGRHFIEKALDANGENAKNVIDIESVITHKYSYDASVEDLGNASILLTQIRRSGNCFSTIFNLRYHSNAIN